MPECGVFIGRATVSVTASSPPESTPVGQSTQGPSTSWFWVTSISNGSQTYSVFAPIVWNNFLLDIELCSCFITFKSKLKTFLFCWVFDSKPVAKRLWIFRLVGTIILLTYLRNAMCNYVKHHALWGIKRRVVLPLRRLMLNSTVAYSKFHSGLADPWLEHCTRKHNFTHFC